MKKVIAATVLILIGLLVWAWFNPRLVVPGISPFVCSVKGEIWVAEPDPLIGAERPGCYTSPDEPEPLEPSTLRAECEATNGVWVDGECFADA